MSPILILPSEGSEPLAFVEKPQDLLIPDTRIVFLVIVVEKPQVLVIPEDLIDFPVIEVEKPNEIEASPEGVAPG